jgi:hypothetical protein
VQNFTGGSSKNVFGNFVIEKFGFGGFSVWEKGWVVLCFVKYIKMCLK